MNLYEASHKVQTQAPNKVELLAKLVMRSQAVGDAVTQLQRDTAIAEQQVRGELKRIPKAAQAVQSVLQEHQQKVLQRISSSETDFSSLLAVVLAGEENLSQANAAVKALAEALKMALPDTQRRLEALVETQRLQLEGDTRAEHNAQESLQESLSKASAAVQRLKEQGTQTLLAETSHINSLTDKLGAVPPLLSSMRETLSSESSGTAKAYLAKLAETQVGVVHAKSVSIFTSTRKDLQEHVEQPARAAVEELIHRALDPMTTQLKQHRQDVSSLRAQPFEPCFRELLAGDGGDGRPGPQLLPMCKASKSVLQKVGRLAELNALGI